jgi:hypothetical protein
MVNIQVVQMVEATVDRSADESESSVVDVTEKMWGNDWAVPRAVMMVE